MTRRRLGVRRDDDRARTAVGQRGVRNRIDGRIARGRVVRDGGGGALTARRSATRLSSPLGFGRDGCGRRRADLRVRVTQAVRHLRLGAMHRRRRRRKAVLLRELPPPLPAILLTVALAVPCHHLGRVHTRKGEQTESVVARVGTHGGRVGGRGSIRSAQLPLRDVGDNAFGRVNNMKIDRFVDYSYLIQE